MNDLALRSFHLVSNNDSLINQRTSQTSRYRRIRQTLRYRVIRQTLRYRRMLKNCTKHNLVVNNQERLDQINSIPSQTTVNDPKIYEFYNGYSFV